MGETLAYGLALMRLASQAGPRRPRLSSIVKTQVGEAFRALLRDAMRMRCQGMWKEWLRAPEVSKEKQNLKVERSFLGKSLLLVQRTQLAASAK